LDATLIETTCLVPDFANESGPRDQLIILRKMKENKFEVVLLLKLSCHFPFTPVENACILRTIDIYLKAVWAYLRFITSNQGKT